MMEPTDPPLSRRRTGPTRSPHLVLVFVSFAVGLYFVCLGSSPTTFPGVFGRGMQQHLLPCGVLLTVLPFLWLACVYLIRMRRRRAAGLARAATVDMHLIFAYYCGFGMVSGLSSAMFIWSRIVTATQQPSIFLFVMVLASATFELYMFSTAGTCLPEPPVEQFLTMAAAALQRRERGVSGGRDGDRDDATTN